MAKKKSEAMIDPSKVSNYKVSDVKTASGRKSIDCDDAVARQLRGKSPDEIKAIAVKSGLGDRYRDWAKTLNVGQVRMAVGNALRKIARDAKKPKMKKAA
jgi:hypothetical protein